MKIISNLSLFFGAVLVNQAWACTYMSLRGDDGTMVSARTMEWGMFNVFPDLAFAPKNSEFQTVGLNEDNVLGKSWTSKYDIMGTSVMPSLEQTLFADGINSEGLSVHMLYHPGTAEYAEFDAKKTRQTITVIDFPSFVLSNCKNVEEVEEKINKLHITGGKTVGEIGMVAPVHFAIADANGDEIVVEFINKKTKIFKETVGVMTNSPPYDWHITNLRNYIYMELDNFNKTLQIGDIELKETGYGTGLSGLPGDYTPVSRFVRAVALRQLARPTDGGEDTIHEVMRILQSFQLPYEGPRDERRPDYDIMKYGATMYTALYDHTELKMYYRTSMNPAMRVVDLKKVNFKNMPKDKRVFLPQEKDDYVYATDVTPKKDIQWATEL